MNFKAWMAKLKTYQRKLRFFWNRHRTWIRVEKRGKFFTLVIHERFRKQVRWFKYILAVGGIISGLFVFSNALHALLFGLALFCIQTLVEKAIFSYHVLVVLPFPNFTVENEKWLGVLSGYAEPPGETKVIPLLGAVFNDEEYARNFYKFLLECNYGEHKDSDNNIVMSVITNETRDKYVFYIYPNPDRRSASAAFESEEKNRKNSVETFTDVQVKNYILLTMGKICKVSPQSYLPTLIRKYEVGIPYFFDFYFTKDRVPTSEQPKKAPGTHTIIKCHLKIRKESELTRKDFEFEMKRDWDIEDGI